MSNADRPIKIKSLPRTGEKPEQVPVPAPVQKSSSQSNNSQIVIIGAAILATAVLFWPDKQSVRIVKHQPVRVEDSPEAQVNQFLAEARMKQQMEMQARELENKVWSKPLKGSDVVVPDSKRPLGVSMDQEGTAEKIYSDIYGNENKNRNAQTPDERISRKIEESQWMSQLEKQERKQYVESFLKEAFDAGYAIDLDENLVVVRVRKVTNKPSQTLDQVLENLSRKGY